MRTHVDEQAATVPVPAGPLETPAEAAVTAVADHVTAHTVQCYWDHREAHWVCCGG